MLAIARYPHRLPADTLRASSIHSSCKLNPHSAHVPGTGLPLVPYFTASKLRWLLDNVPGLRTRADAGTAIAGTMDSYLLWKLTGRHETDVTNASRTLLCNIHTLTWGALRSGHTAFKSPESQFPPPTHVTSTTITNPYRKRPPPPLPPLSRLRRRAVRRLQRPAPHAARHPAVVPRVRRVPAPLAAARGRRRRCVFRAGDAEGCRARTFCSLSRARYHTNCTNQVYYHPPLPPIHPRSRQASWAISSQPCLGRRASSLATPRTRMGRGASCCSTRAVQRCRRTTGC